MDILAVSIVKLHTIFYMTVCDLKNITEISDIDVDFRFDTIRNSQDFNGRGKM